MNTPDGVTVTPRILSGKPHLVLTRQDCVIAYVPVTLQRKDGRLLLADVTVRALRAHGVDAAVLE